MSTKPTGWRDARFEELDRLIAAEPERRGSRRGPRDPGRLEAKQARMLAQQERAACPRSFLCRTPKRPAKPLTPEQQGYRDGLDDRHYLPRLNFRRSEDWLAWYRGWQAGQAELRRQTPVEVPPRGPK